MALIFAPLVANVAWVNAATPAERPVASDCWDVSGFSFAGCCLTQNPACWDDVYFTHSRCCVTSPVLSTSDISAFDTPLDCGCGTPSEEPIEDNFWCDLYKIIGRDENMPQQHYKKFLTFNASEIATCPMGAISLMSFDLFVQVKMGHTDLNSIPSFVWMRDWFKKSGRSMIEIAGTPWRTFVMFSMQRAQLRESVVMVDPESKAQCGDSAAARRMTQVVETYLYGDENSREMAGEPILALVFDTGISVDCPVALAARALYGMQTLRWRAWYPDLRQHDVEMQAIISSANRLFERFENDIFTLFCSRWPFFELLDGLRFFPRVTISIDAALRTVADTHYESTSTFVQRVFPRREIISDHVRLHKVPLCGMGPFIRLVDRMTTRPELARYTMIEGGPHLGDCTLLGASVLKNSWNVPPRMIAYEPLDNASQLFRLSALENSLEVTVRMAALGDRSISATTDLWYYSGRNGQATMTAFGKRADGQHIIRDIPKVSLDDDFAEHEEIGVLKLSVNGAEVETLRGARRLLSRRQICLVMMHVKKVVMGHESDPEFSSSLQNSLEGYDINYYRERSKTSPGRPLRLVHNSTELNDILHANIRDNYYSHDYLFATPRDTASCTAWRELMESISVA